MFISSAGGLVLGALLFVIALLILVVLIGSMPMAIWLALRGAETTGHVSKVDKQRPGRTPWLRVAYDTPEGRFETRAFSRQLQIGETVPVRYDPAKPKRASASLKSWRIPLIGIPSALIVAALSAGLVIGSAWYFAGIHTRLQSPLTEASFSLLITLACGYGTWNRCTVLMRWRRMVRVDGKILRYEDYGRTGRIWISFPSSQGAEEFWALAGTAPGGVGDTVTVYYDPAKPAKSATVQETGTIRAYAILGTVVALISGALGVYALTML